MTLQTESLPTVNPDVHSQVNYRRSKSAIFLPPFQEESVEVSGRTFRREQTLPFSFFSSVFIYLLFASQWGLIFNGKNHKRTISKLSFFEEDIFKKGSMQEVTKALFL